MSLAKGVLGAMAGGAIGGALWVGVAYMTGWELSLLAIIVGGCVGFGMGMGNKGAGGVPAGLLAAVVAVFAILGAKVGVAHIIAQRWMESENLRFTEEDARSALMETVYTQFIDKDVEMTEPEDADDYPPEVWTEADRRWHAMSVSEREAYRVGLQEEFRAGMEEASGVLTIVALIFSFGLFDLLCFGLAVGSAYKTASTTIVKEDAEPIETVRPPAMFRVAGVEAAQGMAVSPAAAAPAPPAPSAAPPEEPVAGLGIFARLGQEAPPAASAPALQPEPAHEPEPGREQPPRQEIGLINLDLGDEKRAA